MTPTDRLRKLNQKWGARGRWHLAAHHNRQTRNETKTACKIRQVQIAMSWQLTGHRSVRQAEWERTTTTNGQWMVKIWRYWSTRCNGTTDGHATTSESEANITERKKYPQCTWLCNVTTETVFSQFTRVKEHIATTPEKERISERFGAGKRISKGTWRNDVLIEVRSFTARFWLEFRCGVALTFFRRYKRSD